MRSEQQIIAAWMRRVMEAKGWTPADWARAAKLGAATTISRALGEDYSSVTSVPTLHQLARGAQETSILDFLEGAEPQAVSLDFSEERLQQLASEAVEEVQAGMSIGEIRRVVAARLHELLGLVAASEAGSHHSAPSASLALDARSRRSTN